MGKTCRSCATGAGPSDVKILVLNPGSSSLKRAFYEFPQGVVVPETDTVDAAGIRVVHGGSRFVKPVRVDDSVVEEIGKLAELAPLHNPIAVKVIEETRKTHPGVPVIAVFDTAFHQAMPPLAARYAVPRDLGVRRFGFHGISYSYIASRVDARRHIVCHLGNGASVCALRDGRSVDTSMGFTPMEGLVMGTRAGDADAAFALEMFAYRVAKYVGAYAAVLGGVDALTFTAGIGEHSAFLRSRICHRLEFLGVEIDEELNRAARTDERCISLGRIKVRVIPTNEDLEIARMTFHELSARSGAIGHTPL